MRFLIAANITKCRTTGMGRQMPGVEEALAAEAYGWTRLAEQVEVACQRE